MITVTDDAVAWVAGKDEPVAQLRVLLILAQQVVAASGGETAAVRELFTLIRELVDELAHQAASANPTQSDTPMRAGASAEQLA